MILLSFPATADEGAELPLRLSIMDPSAAGHQPMVSVCGRYVVVFKGEIYKPRELSRALAADGVPSRSGSDAEVVLAQPLERQLGLTLCARSSAA